MGIMLGRRWRSLGAVLGLALALCQILGAVGPQVDHHYVERLPSHGHWYLDRQPRDHSHPYELTHTHSHGAPSDQADGIPLIAFFPEYNGGLLDFLALDLGLLALSILVLPHLFTQPVPLLSQAGLRSAIPLVPVPPPRHSL